MYNVGWKTIEIEPVFTRPQLTMNEMLIFFQINIHMF